MIRWDDYKDKNITETKDNEKIRITGTVVKKGKDFFIQDGEREIKVISEAPIEKDIIRVYGTFEKNSIKADFIEDMSGLDLKTYQKVKKTIYSQTQK